LQDARVPAYCYLVQRGRLSANMIAEALRAVAGQGNTTAKDTAKMTEGKPGYRISPAEGPGL